MVWSWIDGTNITTSYGFNSDRSATTGQGPWYSGEPNEAGNEDCVEMWIESKYNDKDCGYNNYPLCRSM